LTYRSAGCKIGDTLDNCENGRRIEFTEEIATDALKKVPTDVVLYPTAADSPNYTKFKLNSDECYHVNTGGDYIWDYELNKMRPATMKDSVANHRLVDACAHMDGLCSPIYWIYDVFPKEDFSRYGAFSIGFAIGCLHSGKTKINPYATSHREEIPDMIRIWQYCAGGPEAFRARPNASLVLCPISPFFLSGSVTSDDPMGHADSLVHAAKAGVPISIGPCGILGISGPITVAGTLAQSVAEFLGVNVAIQAINPGNPVLLNDYTASGDMHTGVRCEASPDSMFLHLGFKAMAQYMNVAPLVGIGSSAVEANAQFGWEMMMVYLSQSLYGGGITWSAGNTSQDDLYDPLSLLMNNEMIDYVKHFVKGIEVNEATIPIDTMVKTGAAPIGGNFLKSGHTLKNYKNTIWKPTDMTNVLSRDAWLSGGEVGIIERARKQMAEMLETHEPDIPEEQQKGLRGIISEILDREGIKGDDAKSIMDKTYFERL